MPEQAISTEATCQEGNQTLESTVNLEQAQKDAKPFICGTMNQDELEEATAKWFAKIDDIYSDCILHSLMDTCKTCGPDYGSHIKVKDQIWQCLLDTTLDDSEGLLQPLIKAEIFDKVDLQKVCKRAEDIIFDENSRRWKKGSTLYNPAVIGLAIKRVLTEAGLTIHGKGVIETDDESGAA